MQAPLDRDTYGRYVLVCVSCLQGRSDVHGLGVRLAGLEPTASASAGLRSIQLSYKRSNVATARLLRGVVAPNEGLVRARPDLSFPIIAGDRPYSASAPASTLHTTLRHLMSASMQAERLPPGGLPRNTVVAVSSAATVTTRMAPSPSPWGAEGRPRPSARYRIDQRAWRRTARGRFCVILNHASSRLFSR